MNIRYGKALKAPRRAIKCFLSALYPIVTRMWPLPKVLSIDETLDKIINDNVSICRFGDGEFLYIIDKLNLPFQKYEVGLADKLKSILVAKDQKILVGLPVGYQSLIGLNKESRLTWKSQVTWIYPRLKKFLAADKIYYNSSMTRVYAPYKDKMKSKEYFEKLMKIWERKDVLIIEGEKSRLGVGNNLFLNTNSVERILAPMHHAYTKYKELFSEALKHERSKLILIALGPTATALAYDLAQQGFQAVDIGNIDIEYEWYLQGATSKPKIKGKYTSEAIGGREVEDIIDHKYNSEIKARIL